MRVRFFAPAKVRDRIALKAVGAALHDDELWSHGVQVRLDLFPGLMEVAVIRARRERDVQLGATCTARAGLLGSAGAGVKKAAVFVEVGEQQIGVVLETVKDAVAMMGININVGNALDSKLLAQILDRDPAVVEYAESGSACSRRVMQSGNRDECALVVSVHDLIDGTKHGSDNGRCRVIDSGHGGRIALVEPAVTGRGHTRHLVDVVRRMEKCQLVDERRSRVAVFDDIAKTGFVEFGMKDVVTIGTEWMRIAKPVRSDRLPPVNQHVVTHGHLVFVCL